MRQILHSYKLRLTNLSQGNRSLRLGKLSRHQDIDLRDLHYVEDDGAEEIFQKVLAGRSCPSPPSASLPDGRYC
ncbi:MAG: hypothetical protein AAFP00_14275 [Bacteroidota bacterium]